jgi:hypothetical protein
MSRNKIEKQALQQGFSSRSRRLLHNLGLRAYGKTKKGRINDGSALFRIQGGESDPYESFVGLRPI